MPGPDVLSLLSTESLLLVAGAYASYKASTAKSVPGPWYTKFTLLEHMYNMATGVSWKAISECHDKYGPIVRLGPNEVSITDMDALRTILSTHKFRKGKVYAGLRFRGDDNIVSVSDPVVFKSRKKLIGPAFSNISLQQIEPAVKEMCNIKLPKLIDQRIETGKPVDMMEAYMSLTLDIITELCFGKTLNMLGGENHHIHPMLEAVGLLTIGKVVAGDTLAGILMPKFKKKRINYSDLVDERKAMENPPRDTLQALIEAVDEDTGKPLPSHNLAAELIVILMAGSDTTAGSLVWALDETFPSIDETITYDKIQNLPYLNAVIHESLRHLPITGLEFDRVTPPEGATLCNHFLPGGTTIKLVAYPIMHDKNNFEKPYEFYPERWLVSYEELATLKQKFFGFSMGARVCLGRNLAWMELRMGLALLVRRYEFSLAPGYDTTPILKLLLIPRDAALMLNMRKRTA
ncbi:cytochrome P450 [Syncephalis fuscata]|nr:cytochrome P450 [Syncephalis fuscata]